MDDSKRQEITLTSGKFNVSSKLDHCSPGYDQNKIFCQNIVATEYDNHENNHPKDIELSAEQKYVECKALKTVQREGNVLSESNFDDWTVLDVCTESDNIHSISEVSEQPSNVGHHVSDFSSSTDESSVKYGRNSITSQPPFQKQSNSGDSASNLERNSTDSLLKSSSNPGIEKLRPDEDESSVHTGKSCKQDGETREQEQSPFRSEKTKLEGPQSGTRKTLETESLLPEDSESHRRENSESRGRENSESRRRENSKSRKRKNSKSRKRKNSESRRRENSESRRRENSESRRRENSESRRREYSESRRRDNTEFRPRREDLELCERIQPPSCKRDGYKRKSSPFQSNFRHGSEGRFPKPSEGSNIRNRLSIGEMLEDCQRYVISCENRSVNRSRSPEPFERHFSDRHRQFASNQGFSTNPHSERSPRNSRNSQDNYEGTQFYDESFQSSRSPNRRRYQSFRSSPLHPHDRRSNPEYLPPDEWHSTSDASCFTSYEFPSVSDSRQYFPGESRPVPDSRSPSRTQQRPQYERERFHHFTQHDRSDRSHSTRKNPSRNEFFDHSHSANLRIDGRPPPFADMSRGRSRSPHRRAKGDGRSLHNGSAMHRSNEHLFSNTTPHELPYHLPLESINSCSKPASKPAQSGRNKSSLFEQAISSLAVLHNDECRAYMKRPTSHPLYNAELSAYLGSSDCLSLVALGTPQNVMIDGFNSDVWVKRLQEVFEEDWQKKKADMVKLMSAKKSSRHHKKSSGSTSKRAKKDRSSPGKSPKPASEKNVLVSSSSKKEKDDLSSPECSVSSVDNLQSNRTEIDCNQKLNVDLKSAPSSTPALKGEKSLPGLPYDMIIKRAGTSDALATIYSQIFKTSQPSSTREMFEPSKLDGNDKAPATANKPSERYSPGMESDTSTHSPTSLAKYTRPAEKNKKVRSSEFISCDKGTSVSLEEAQREEDTCPSKVNVVSILSVVNEFAHKIGHLADGLAELLQRTRASVEHGINPLTSVSAEDLQLCTNVYDRLNAIVNATSTSFIEKVIVLEALSQLSTLLALLKPKPRKIAKSEIEEWANVTLHMNPSDTILFLKKKISGQQNITQTVEQLYMAVKEHHKNLIKSNLQDKISFFLPSTGDSHSANKSNLVNTRNPSKTETSSVLKVHPAFSVYDDIDDDDDDENGG